MSDYVMPSLRRKPTEVILHVATNDAMSSVFEKLLKGLLTSDGR